MARSNENFIPQQEELVGIALDLFLEKGYENTTITDIMRASGLSKGGLYHYFASKEEILDGVIQMGLQQEIEEYTTTLKTLPVDQQLLYFIQSNEELGEFTQKLLRYKTENQNSYASYRIREYNIHMLIPVLADILRVGVEAGLYQTDYPDEMAEFCVLLVKAIVDERLLPEAVKEKRLRRFQAFMHLIKHMIHPAKESHWKDIENLFAQELDKLYEEKPTDEKE